MDGALVYVCVTFNPKSYVFVCLPGEVALLLDRHHLERRVCIYRDERSPVSQSVSQSCSLGIHPLNETYSPTE